MGLKVPSCATIVADSTERPAPAPDLRQLALRFPTRKLDKKRQTQSRPDDPPPE